jgi:PAS domain S-box-containing protein
MAIPLCVLILEDRPADVELMLHELRQAGFEPDWQCVETEADYLAQLHEELDVILADYSLPQFDAMRALHLLQERGLDIPFIVVTGSISEEVAVECMKQGASDYLLKDRLARLGPAVTHALQEKKARDEKRQAEETLQESEEKYRTLVESSLQGITIFQDEHLVFANPAIAELFGYTVEGLVSLPPEDVTALLHPEDRALVMGRIRDRLAGKAAPPRYEFRVIQKSGTMRWVEVSSVPIQYGGKPAVLTAVLDITERKQAEEALRQSEGKYRQLFELESDAIFLIDNETGDILELNLAASALYGYTREELLSMKNTDLSAEPDKTREAVKKQALRVPLRWHRKKDGTVFPVEIAGSHFTWKGRPVHIAAIRDVTERNRAEEALERQATQLALLNDIGGQIAAVLELDEVLDRAVHLVQQRFGYHHVALFTLERERDELVMRARAGDFAALFPPDHRQKLGQGMVGWVGLHGQTLLANDVDAEPRYICFYPGVIPTRSELSVPIRVDEKVVGVLDVQSPQLNAFDENDVMVMETLAAQIAVAIENARLYEEEHKRATQLELIGGITQKIASILDLDELLSEVTRLIRDAFSYYYAGILLVETDSDELVLRAVAGPSVETLVNRLRLKIGQEGITGWVAHSGEPLLVNDVSREPRYYSLEESKDAGSELAVPIRLQKEIIGVLNVESVELDAFGRKDVFILQTLADQIAVAIANARLYEEVVRRLRETETLSAITATLARSLDLDQVLQAIMDSVPRLIPDSNSGVIHLVDQATRKLIPRATLTPEVNIQEELEMSVGEGIAGLAAQEKRPINVPNVEEDAHFLPSDIPTSKKSLLAAPLISDGDCIGTLSLNSDQVGAFNAEDERLLTTLAAQAALAVRNARLHQEIQRRVEELTFLNRVGRAVTSSLDLEQILRTVMEETARVLKIEAGSILLLDEESGELVFEAAVGPRAKEMKGLRLPLGQGIAGWVAQEGQPLLVADVREDPRFYPGIDEAIGFVSRSVLAVPLKARGTVIGVIEAVNKTEGDFVQEDMALLSAMARSAAIAIENAQLFEQARWEIDERKRAEAALEKERASLERRVAKRTADLNLANAELARTARLKDEFLASMSHELRTPLNAILGMSEGLQEEVYGPLNEKQLRSLHTIETSGRHLLSLINDILDVSKIEAGKLELELGLVSVESVGQASLGLIKQAAHKKQLRVSSAFDGVVTIIQADGRRLKQILVNLLDNAVKFTPEGGAIGLEVVGDAERQVVHFTVWDTGIGISEEDMGRLFQPFVQLDSSLSRQRTGTGLGLSLVYRLAELHGGSVSVESEVGEGSRFTVSLPWRERDEEIEGQGGEEAESPPLSLVTLPPDRSATILLAEDNESSIETISDYLQAKGYQVLVARDGAEAIARTREERPDLILMDIQMPGIDGLEATQRIRADLALEGIPIIALTALAMPGDRERCLAAGADEYLSKPVNLKKLVEMIEAQYEAGKHHSHCG